MTDLNDKLNSLADEMEDAARPYEGDLKDSITGWVEALREYADTPAPQAAPSDELAADRVRAFLESRAVYMGPVLIDKLLAAAAPASLTPAPQGTASDYMNELKDKASRIDIHLTYMQINKHYRERVFNQIVEADTAEGLHRFARVAASLTQAATSEPVAPEGYVIAPHYRGFARLGIGAYIIGHSAAGEAAELYIKIATDAEKSGRVVGDLKPTATDAVPVEPEDIAVRICFESAAGLEALEYQLAELRREHFVAPAAPVAHLSGTTPNTEAPSYQQLFNAIAAATRIEAGGIAISVKAFSAALSAQQAGVQEAPKGDIAAWAAHRIAKAKLTTESAIYMIVKMACDRAALASQGVKGGEHG